MKDIIYFADISHHHPMTDYQYYADKCKLIVSKATEGTSYVDPTLDTFIKNCEKYGIPYWLYTFLRKGNEVAQTQFMVKTCESKVGKHFMGYILDVESGNTLNGVRDALNYLVTVSPKCMVYTMYAEYNTYKSLLNMLGRDERYKNVAWWEARYGLNNGSDTSDKYPCHLLADVHQYTSKKSFKGIAGSIDFNKTTGNRDAEWFYSNAEPYKKKLPIVLPIRGYFQNGDGKETLKSERWKKKIRKIQKYLNWYNPEWHLAVDGVYGAKTSNAVKQFKKDQGMANNGHWGRKCNKVAYTIKK